MNPRSCFLLAFLFVVTLPNHAFGQEVIVRKDANLRADPSTSYPPEGKVHQGDKLTLLDPTPEHGYYQVKTASGQEGWVFSKSIRIVASPSPSQPPTDPENPATGAPAQCDDTLWNHVYHSQRLVVKQPCLVVTGTVVDATNGKEPDGVRHEPDGDTHGWLKVDPGFEDLLNAGNLNNEGGNLVFEIVCRFPVTQPDAKAGCTNFSSNIQIPPVGSHVQIVGSYVRDTYHAKWMEIHPVTSITIVP